MFGLYHSTLCKIAETLLRPLLAVYRSLCIMQVRRHTIKCEFKVHCDTQLGDHVMVVGSHPALGSWDAEHGGALALTQQTDDSGVWSGVMSLDWPLRDYSSQMVSFKVREWAAASSCAPCTACVLAWHDESTWSS
jgi:hypothetical protein